MDTKKQKPNLIPKPLQRAFYAGVAAGGFSFVFGVPSEYIPRVAVAGVCYSLTISWHELGRPKRKKRQIPVNDKMISLEYSYSQPGYISRDTLRDKVSRLVYGRNEINAEVKPRYKVSRPAELDEFIFISQGIQLREKHVKLFLVSAWRNRQYGKGLSARRWVRNSNRRPAWYKELSPVWFYAMRQLLFDTQVSLSLQMVIMTSNQWLMLANEPFMTMRLLKWYESEKRG